MNDGVIPVLGSFYRCVVGDREPLDTTGSLTNCGRFNVAGCSALYLSDAPNVALAEQLHLTDLYGIREFTKRSVYTVRVRLDEVLDLNDEAVLRLLRISRESLALPYSEDPKRPTITQIVAIQARKSGIQGLLARSVIVPERNNLVVFRDNVALQNALEVIRCAEQLGLG